jgi:hypothetical protein
LGVPSGTRGQNLPADPRLPESFARILFLAPPVRVIGSTSGW